MRQFQICCKSLIFYKKTKIRKNENYNIFRTLMMFLSPCTGHLLKIISTKLKMTIVCMGGGGAGMVVSYADLGNSPPLYKN